MADVRETRRILEQIPHWAPFTPTEFQLMAGSRLYGELSQQERGALKIARRFRLPPRTSRWALEHSFEVPRSLRPERRVRQAWRSFERHYERARARHRARRPRLDVIRVAQDALRFTDTRNGALRCHDFSGDAARVYDACHRGLKFGEVVRETGLPPRTVRARLARFLRLKLVVRVDDDYLSLAIRPRDELLRRFFVGRAV